MTKKHNYNLKEDFLQILDKLISFETTEDKPTEINTCFDYIKQQFNFFEFKIKEHVYNEKKSLYISTSNTKHTKYLLSAHIDVVPASKEMFHLKNDNSKLIGRGVFDMKFAVALFIVTLKKIYFETKKLPSLAILLTSEEEVDGNNGVGAVLENHSYKADLAILPDGGENWHVVTKSKGLLQIKLTEKGISAHGAYPWLGQNAINKLIFSLQKLQNNYPIPKNEEWITTLNIGKIFGGNAINKVCDEANALIDIRFTEKDSQEKIISKIKKILPNSELEIIDHLPAFFVEEKNLHLQKWHDLIKTQNKNIIFVQEHGASDATYFTQFGISVLMSQPVGGKIHTEEEWLDLNSLLDYQKYFEEFLKK